MTYWFTEIEYGESEFIKRFSKQLWMLLCSEMNPNGSIYWIKIDTHEKLVFELIKRIDSGHGITYIGELPTEIKTLAQIHDFSIKNANFDVEYGPTIAAFISNVDQVFSIADFESWFSHLNWKSSFNYLIANDLVFSCKLGFRKNPLIPAVQLNDDDVGILGTLCKKAMTVQQVDPLLQAVESTEKDDSDDWMSE